MAIKTLAMRSPGETGDDSLHPLLGDGSRPELIALDRYDGDNVQHLVANAVTVSEVGAASVRAARRTKNRVMVGQIRYPWVRAVGASTHGRNTEDKLRIRYVEKYPDMELHKTLDLTFAKGTDTTLIAQDITRRVAEFRLAHYPDMEDQEREAFARLRQDPPRPEPEPKKFAFTNMPTCFPVSPKTAYPQF